MLIHELFEQIRQLILEELLNETARLGKQKSRAVLD